MGFAIEAMAPRTETTAIACSLTSKELRERRAMARERLWPHLEATETFAHGLTLTFPNTDAIRATVEEFVGLERQCCGFLTFIVTPPEQGLAVRIEGPPEAAATLAMFATAIGDKT